MKKLTRILLSSVIVCLLMMLFVSCESKTATDVQLEIDSQDICLPENKVYDHSTTELVTKKYSGYDYDGYTFTILGISPGKQYYYRIADDANEIWYEEDSADIQRHEVVQRNILTEDLLNARISYVGGGDAFTMYDNARSTALAGLDEYDLMLNAHFRALLCGICGWFYNLFDIDTLDRDAYWWNQEYNDTFTYKHKILYNITGDALIFDDLAVMVVYYNLNMINDRHLPDPADLTESGDWTIENMMTLANAVVNDSDGDGVMTENDTWGVLDGGHTALERYFDGCGIRVAEKDEDGVPYLAAEEADFVEAVEFVFNQIFRSGSLYTDLDEEVVRQMMREDKGLFYQHSLSELFALRTMESDFRFVPMPKYNASRETYTSKTSGKVTSVFAIPITVRDTDRVGIFLNVLGGYSTDTVDRTLYEVLLGAKLIRDERTLTMLDYCLKSKYYDWGKDLKWAFPIYQLMIDQQNLETFYYASGIRRMARQSRAMLKQMLGGHSFY